MGNFISPSGKQVCFVKDGLTVLGPDPYGTNECKRMGFDGLFEPRTNEDVQFTIDTYECMFCMRGNFLPVKIQSLALFSATICI